ncbi:hypothetical protein SRABI84_05233 [Peribacillus simplex]|nr:hypothetical protein SRABI84_05233 [Peribacillus simplex]
MKKGKPESQLVVYNSSWVRNGSYTFEITIKGNTREIFSIKHLNRIYSFIQNHVIGYVNSSVVS